MLALALLLQAAPQTAVDAERAFALRAAQTRQWAAFREYSTPDAVMFVPHQVNAHDWLAAAKEPKISVQWWPAESYVSCDGRMAVNTGPWAIPSSRLSGYFTTIWTRQADGSWKWIYDAGDSVAAPQAAGDRAKVRRASCRRKADDALGDADPGAEKQGMGRSADGTLQWRWTTSAGGARGLDVYLWNGREMERVIEDRVDAPAAP